jgi:hypothetical protein
MKKYLIAGILSLTLAIPFACHLTKKNQLDCTSIPATYANDIAPIISKNCLKCHGYGSNKGDFTTYDGLNIKVKSGEFEKEVLIKKEMPPNGPLPEEDRKKIRCWLNNGAPNN